LLKKKKKKKRSPGSAAGYAVLSVLQTRL